MYVYVFSIAVWEFVCCAWYVAGAEKDAELASACHLDATTNVQMS
jgi:hypothetical protein